MDSATPEAEGRRGRLAGLHDWVVRHDDSRLFVVAYIGLAVVLSIWIGLFWLVAVVAVHFAFEVVRQSTRHAGWRGVLAEAFWELKLDLALVLFALVISLYMEVVLGVLGLQAAARAAGAGLRGGARFAGWQRVLRGLLLSVDDAAQVARFAAARRRGDAAGEAVEDEGAGAATSPWGSWGASWDRGDRAALAFGAACVLLLVAAPFLTEHTYGSALWTLAAELHPFPAGAVAEAVAAE